MVSKAVSRGALLAVACLGASLPVAARTYCCKDDGGRRICGDILPAVCFNRAYQEYNASGALAKEVEAPLTPEQRARRQAEEAKKKEEARKVTEQERLDRALLTSYTSVKDIEAKRDRTLTDLHAGLRLAEERSADAQSRLAQLKDQAEKSRQKPIPEPLRIRIQKGENEVATQQLAIDAKKKDIVEVQERFERDIQRYLALTRKQAEDSQPKPATAPASSSTVR